MNRARLSEGRAMATQICIARALSVPIEDEIAARTGEITNALVAVPATIIALRPEAKVPSQLRTKTFFRGTGIGGRA
jgi:hypothetical protein